VCKGKKECPAPFSVFQAPGQGQDQALEELLVEVKQLCGRRPACALAQSTLPDCNFILKSGRPGSFTSGEAIQKVTGAIKWGCHPVSEIAKLNR